MAYDSVVLKNPNTNETRTAPVGVSWTTLFFGFIPAISRKDYNGALVQFLCACCTLGFSNWYFLFKYNNRYIASLIQDGYIPAHSISGKPLKRISQQINLPFPENKTENKPADQKGQPAQQGSDPVKANI
jgi:hypothetical protein